MPTLNLQVCQSNDDVARHTDAAAWNLTHVAPFIGYYDGTYKAGGSAFRFQNVTIPPGATISAAYLVFRAYTTRSGTTVNTRIQGENNTNPAAFSTEADFAARQMLSTHVHWNNIGAWTSGTEYSSADISAIIQAIVNLSGWASGNALVLVWEDWEKNSTQAEGTYRSAYHYDGSTAYAPTLHIEYTTGDSQVYSSDSGAGTEAVTSRKITGTGDTGGGLENGGSVSGPPLAVAAHESAIGRDTLKLLAQKGGAGLDLGNHAGQIPVPEKEIYL